MQTSKTTMMIKWRAVLALLLVSGCSRELSAVDTQRQSQLEHQKSKTAAVADSSVAAPTDVRASQRVSDPTEPDNAGKPHGADRPTATQIADWVREAYANREELAYDFTISQVQRNDRTWTYQGSARYSGRKSLVTMTETEGTRVGRQLRYACDIDGDTAFLVEQDRNICISYTIPAESLKKPTLWDRRLPVNTQCIFGVVLKSWLGSEPVAHHVNKTHEYISQGEFKEEQTVTDADGNEHVCYAVMNGVEGSYEVYFVDKSSHLVRRWFVDRTTITRDSVYTYREPDPKGPDFFRLSCPDNAQASSDAPK